jgi:integrase
MAKRKSKNIYGKLIIRSADASGVDMEKAEEVFANIWTVIANEMKKGPVMIPGFGVFGPLTPPCNDTQQVRSGGKFGASTITDPRAKNPEIPRRRLFRAAAALLERINAPIPPEKDEDEPVVSTILPLRDEDRDLIEAWLANRAGQSADTAIEQALFETTDRRRRRLRFIAPSTVNTGRKTMRHFARRCSVPLLRVGMSPAAGKDYEIFEKGAERKEILAYADQYTRDLVKKLGPDGLRIYRTAASRNREAQQTPVPFLTPFWVAFIRYAFDFYEWCESQGMRPRGTNPFTHIKRHTALSLSRGRIAIRRAWYEEVLKSPKLTARESALCHLMQNGLRASEVRRVQIEDIIFEQRKLIVRSGKGKKRREVPLYPWTVSAIDRWLDNRRTNTSPWLFPKRHRQDHPISYSRVWSIVRDIAYRLFPDNEEARTRIPTGSGTTTSRRPELTASTQRPSCKRAAGRRSP